MPVNSSDNATVDNQIYDCFDLDNPKSFFLFAGAGSGKTRSLVNVLERIKQEKGDQFRLLGKKIAIITYTNAASDEIISRLENDSIFHVSTIHSFVWDIIRNYPHDIRSWLQKNIAEETAELQLQQSKGRATSKAALDRTKKIESNAKRLEKLKEVKRFIYNPNGENRTKDSLSHTEVISIAADFLNTKTLLQQILISRFPILLVDESQDTKKDLIDAFFTLQRIYAKQFTLGLFGDTMQRIYSDGKENLGQSLPADWIKPAKIVNHRCPKRVVMLINKIRLTVDGQQQESPEDKEEGLIRFFIVPSGLPTDKEIIERNICNRMAEIAGDDLWKNNKSDVKTLTLEHHMAARRMGFLGLFEALYKADKLKTGLLDGSLPGVRFFTQIILPIVTAKGNNDEFSVARIVRRYSPFFDTDKFKNETDQIGVLRSANDAVNALYKLWENNADPKLIDILKKVYASKLFALPESLNIIAKRTDDEIAAITLPESDEENGAEVGDDVIDAWDAALENGFSQIESYNEYILDKASYGTHQGVKGLQFPRVLVVLDDEEARGFLFSFDKILGLKSPSETDLKNMKEKKETSIDRTLRLFYVACSRAQKSLAIVAYTSSPDSVQKHIQNIGWIEADEIEILGSSNPGN